MIKLMNLNYPFFKKKIALNKNLKKRINNDDLV